MSYSPTFLLPQQSSYIFLLVFFFNMDDLHVSYIVFVAREG